VRKGATARRVTSFAVFVITLSWELCRVPWELHQLLLRAVPPETWRSPTKPHLSKLLPFLHIATLETKLPVHEPWGKKPQQRSPCPSLLSSQLTKPTTTLNNDSSRNTGTRTLTDEFSEQDSTHNISV
jgi:hypothetical protein